MDFETYYIAALTLILVIGVGAHMFGRLTRVPSILLLLLVGLLVGPAGLNFVRPELFGEGIRAIVAIAVVIIVFEGGININVSALRAVSRDMLLLVWLGSSITFVGFTIAAHFVAHMSWSISALLGAILTATGPTVISPLVRQSHIKQKASQLLEFEGVFNDAISIILAATVFEWVLFEHELQGGLFLLMFRLLSGLVIGIAGGVLLRKVLSIELLERQTAKLFTLSFVFALYTVAELVADASGILAVASCGLMVGVGTCKLLESAEVLYRDTVKEFKEDLTIILIAVIFILLAAYFRPEDAMAVGWGGVLVVLMLMFIIRPVAVLASTYASHELSLKDRMFISLTGPRGVVPASMAVYFAMRLGGNPQVASTMVGMVFLTVIFTVVFASVFTRLMASRMGMVSMEMCIVGGGSIGRVLTERFVRRGERVVVIDVDKENCRIIKQMGGETVQGDAADVGVLKKAGLERAKYLIATTNQDNTNLLVCQLAKSKFRLDKDRIVARVNNPENLKAFKDVGIRAMSPVLSTAMTIENLIDSPDLLLTEVSMELDIIERELKNPALFDKALKELELAKNCLVILIKRQEESHVPHGDFVLKKGDYITLIGKGDGVRKTAELIG
ncbi:MAG: cation:proton antiporter domain-containing protein [Methermicoccaceae archaeon]